MRSWVVSSVTGRPDRTAAGARPDLPPGFVGTETPVPEILYRYARTQTLRDFMCAGLVLVWAGRIRGRSRGLPAGGYFLETIGVFGDRPNGQEGSCEGARTS